MVLNHFKGTVPSTKKLVAFSNWAWEDVIWWLNLDIKDCNMSLRCVPIQETYRLARDAMDTAVGSVFVGKVMYEELDEYISKWRISHKEWLVVDWTIKSILASLKTRII